MREFCSWGERPSAEGRTFHPGTRMSQKKPRLLLVEDHADTRKVLSRILQTAGIDVETAETCAEAEEKCNRQQFDLLVSDVGLPDQSGCELMRRLRQRYGLRGIAISGHVYPEDYRRSEEAGFTEHLPKPLTPSALIEAIQRVLAQTSGAGS